MLDDNCIFCKIAAGEIPSETVYEDEQFRAILDLGPASAGHTLILPKAHFKDVTEISDEYAANVLKVAAKLGKAMKKGLGCEGFNLVQNNGEAAGQTVMPYACDSKICRRRRHGFMGSEASKERGTRKAGSKIKRSA